MNNKKKVATLLTLLASTTLVIGTVVAVQSNGFSNFMTMSESDNKVTLNASNGKTTVSSLKTNNVGAKTFKDNNVSFDYKNNQVVEGKVTKILAGGFYGNHSPLHDMQSIRVTSNAGTGDAKVYYGKSSAHMTEFVDLAATSGDGAVISGNFFKIEASNDVEITSIEVGFGCETKSYDDVAYNDSGDPIANAYKFTFATDHYYMSRNSGYGSAKTVIVPDYYDDGEHGQHPVTVLGDGSSTGCFEGSSALENVYLPETITQFERYNFYAYGSANQIKEFTLPLELTSIASYAFPKTALETLNIHSRNISSSSRVITSDYSPNLKTINVSADVTHLPDIITSWPSTAETINYEGTEAEWADLLDGATTTEWKNFPGEVYCSDTVLATVTLHHTNATLNTVADETVLSTKIGKSYADFGSPVYNDGTKKFVGWFDAASGGNQIVFPYVVSANADIYAHFEDYGAGISFANPIIVTMGQSYNYETDASHLTAYFQYTATSNEVIIAKVTSAAAAYNDYVYFHVYDSTQTAITVSSGNSAANEVNKASVSSSFGTNIPLKVRLAAGESIFVTVDGNGNASRFGALTVSFNLAGAGEDYTTANVYNSGDVVATPARYGVTWYSFTPSVTDSYLFTGNATAWCGGSLGHFVDNAYTNDAPSSSAFNVSYGTTKRTLVTLTAGTTYYFGFTTNTAGAQLTFSVSNELDPGMAKSSAITVTVGGSAVVVPYDSDFPTVWYKFVASETGEHRLVVDNDTTIYTSGSSRPLFAVEDASGTAVAIDAGRTVHDKKVAVTSGETYYVSITTSSTAKNFEFSVETVAAEATVTVYANGPAAAATSAEVIDAGNPFVLADPVYTSNGHTYYTGFQGWYTDASLDESYKFTSGDIISADTNIYAKLSGSYQSDLFNTINSLYTGCFSSMTAGLYHWVLDSGNIISTNGRNAASGTGVKSSSSEMAFVAAKPLTISFDYSVSSENSDKLYVYTRTTAGGSRTTELSVGGTSSASFSKTIAAGNVIELLYTKDSSVDTNNDMVTLSNFSVVEASNVNLTYNFQDGVTADQVVEVLSNSSITKITDPTRTGYRFDGWYTEPLGAGTQFNFTTGISSDTTIYAKWVEQITITIYADGPDKPSTSTVNKDKGSTYSPSTPSGDAFEGWFTDSDCTVPYDSTASINTNISLYAKWSGKYKYQVFNDVDAYYAGVFSNITGTTSSYKYKFAAGVFTSGNYHSGSTSSEITLTLAADYYVSFDWEVSSESGWDKGTITITDGSIVTKPASEVSGTNSGSYDSGTTVLHAGTTIKFYYSKDGSGDSGTDTFVIKNLVFTAA